MPKRRFVFASNDPEGKSGSVYSKKPFPRYPLYLLSLVMLMKPVRKKKLYLLR